MKCFAVLAVLVAASQAQYLPYGAGLARPYAAGLATPYAAGYGAPLVRAAPYAGRPLLRAAPIARPAVAVKAAPAPLLKAAPIAAPVLKAAPIAAPVAVKAAPVHAPGVHATQYHAQDEFGAYEFGYKNPNSARTEKGQAGGGVAGSYSYVDSYGVPQTVNYVADAYGYRTTGTNFPNTAATSAIKGYAAAPIAHRVYKRQAVLAAAPAHLAYGAAPIAAPIAYGAAPIAAPYAGATAVVASAPAAREADLLRIQLNPGHAVHYRVY